MGSESDRSEPQIEEEKVDSRSQGLPEERGLNEPDDAKSQAKKILEESVERTEDPATRNLDDDTVERRKVDDLVPDPEDSAAL